MNKTIYLKFRFQTKPYLKSPEKQNFYALKKKKIRNYTLRYFALSLSIYTARTNISCLIRLDFVRNFETSTDLDTRNYVRTPK